MGCCLMCLYGTYQSRLSGPAAAVAGRGNDLPPTALRTEHPEPSVCSCASACFLALLYVAASTGAHSTAGVHHTHLCLCVSVCGPVVSVDADVLLLVVLMISAPGGSLPEQQHHQDTRGWLVSAWA